MQTLYSILRYLLLPWHLPRESMRSDHSAFDLKHWREMLGNSPLKFPDNTIWLDIGQSVDLYSARRLISKLQAKYTGYTFLMTGYAQAVNLAKDPKLANSCQLATRPLDIGSAVSGFLTTARPRLILMIGSEFTPNLYRQAQIMGVPLVYLNDKEGPRYLSLFAKIPAFGRRVVRDISAVIVQNDDQASQWLALGVSQKRLKLAGYIKNDVKVVDPGISDRLNATPLWPQERVAWLAANVRSEEYALIFDALRRLLASMPELLLVMVPHADTSAEKVAAMCRQRGFLVARHSRSEAVKRSTQVLLVESVDSLRNLYIQSEVVLVGGSFHAKNQDDILIPAASAVPMIVGPQVTSHQDLLEYLVASQAVIQVENAQQLADELERLLIQPEALRKMSEAALRIIDNNRGAIRRVSHILREQLEWTQPAID